MMDKIKNKQDIMFSGNPERQHRNKREEREYMEKFWKPVGDCQSCPSEQRETKANEIKRLIYRENK